MIEKLKPLAASTGLLFLRLAVGLCLTAHGALKLFGDPGIAKFAEGLKTMGFPIPTAMAYLSALTEFGCGALVAVGFLTRLAAIPLAINMLVAVFTAHSTAYFLSNKPPGMEYALNLAAAFAAIALLGPGSFSADAVVFRKKRV